MFKKLFYFICLVLFNTNVKAITFEQYIIDHDSTQMRAYLTGYADAVHNNAFLLGSCPRKMTYRPYGEYFQNIDIYISKKTKDKSTKLDAFYQEPVEPLLTAVILRYTNCNNPESRHLENEPKRVQIEMRNLARNIMDQTRRYQTPEEREKEFMYKQYIYRLDNPQKYAPVSTPRPQIQKKPVVVKPQQKPMAMPKQPSKPALEAPLQRPTPEKQEKSKWYSLHKKEKVEAPANEEIKTDVKVENQVLRIEPKTESVATPIIADNPIKSEKTPTVDVASQLPTTQPQTQQTVTKQEDKPQDITKKTDTPPSTESTKDAKPEQKNEGKVDQKAATPKPEEVAKKPENNYTLKSDDPFTMPEIEIPAQIIKKNIKEIDITDVQAKKYELDSLNINLDNIDNVTLPSL